MKAASLMDPKWIAQQAPHLWMDRVESDPNKPSVSKEVIHNVGPRVLHSGKYAEQHTARRFLFKV